MCNLMLFLGYLPRVYGILSGILSDIYLTYILHFLMAFDLAVSTFCQASCPASLPSILSGVLSGIYSDILSGMSVGPCLPSLMPGAGRSHAKTAKTTRPLRRWCRPDRATRREPESACLLRRMWRLGRFSMAGNSGLKST